MHGHIKKDYKKRAIHRLRIIQGQIKGLEKMVEAEKYCIDILNQSLAIQESLKSFNSLLLQNHLTTHLAEQLKGKSSEQAIKEMLQLYKFNH
ncbi:MAG: hypothetical protein A3J62_03950 [Candidatus Buchananbacteria bacterium RIFCSPHIGHO2_02_FULL_38_8]|uniref:Transcriptional regulator n=1 Tax=Candidatus Buchananbacteria bacterium RIFCSPHIGHO2_02_FULL_38_8 TaxID=1797538 RepID=A0A1G1Y810_9BACT|nr:MAG: hypothetical protein A3J62_03950 [Candidatus Buchananbacteria bacterium RIFCSPHIGHO2_02_FULL_38_8]